MNHLKKFESYKDLKSELNQIFKDEEKEYNEIIDIINWSDDIQFRMEIGAFISFKNKRGDFISVNIYRSKEIKNIIEEIYKLISRIEVYDPRLGNIGNIDINLDETLKCWKEGNHNLALYLNGPEESIKDWIKIRNPLVNNLRSYLPNLDIKILPMGNIKIYWK